MTVAVKIATAVVAMTFLLCCSKTDPAAGEGVDLECFKDCGARLEAMDTIVKLEAYCPECLSGREDVMVCFRRTDCAAKAVASCKASCRSRQ